MMNLRVNGFLACSLTTLASTFCRSTMSLCSYHRMELREICMPFRIAKLTALSATMMSPLFEKAGMTLEMVEKA